MVGTHCRSKNYEGTINHIISLLDIDPDKLASTLVFVKFTITLPYACLLTEPFPAITQFSTSNTAMFDIRALCYLSLLQKLDNSRFQPFGLPSLVGHRIPGTLIKAYHSCDNSHKHARVYHDLIYHDLINCYFLTIKIIFHLYMMTILL